VTLKAGGLFVAALAACSFAALLHATPSADGLAVDITSPAEGSQLAWGAQGSYSVTASYDGKSTKYGDIDANAVLVRTTYVPNLDTGRQGSRDLPEAVLDIAQSNCTGCHDFSASSAGPSFAAIARRYAGKSGSAVLLATHIKEGSKGSWGSALMPPHPEMSAEQTGRIAQWILEHGDDPAVHYSIGNEGSFRMVPVGTPGPRAGTIVDAFYTGGLNAGDSRRPVAGRSSVTIRGTGS
jgi:cytochrome c551/c552